MKGNHRSHRLRTKFTDLYLLSVCEFRAYSVHSVVAFSAYCGCLSLEDSHRIPIPFPIHPVLLLQLLTDMFGLCRESLFFP